ncbi:MAG TPA: hypothetical protein VE736_13495 [Gaiellaceae bacterium]|jgi:hypothetical protein|nr:hypothetical protein [Gaiellaceae bacterium]
MRNEARGLRERIHEAIEEPIDEAEKLLSELTSADIETKLSILLSGWGRALAAGLEELAIAIDELQQPDTLPTPDSAPPPPDAEVAGQRTPDEQSEHLDAGDLGEQRLIDEAKKSRAATAELREEAERIRRDLEP